MITRALTVLLVAHAHSAAAFVVRPGGRRPLPPSALTTPATFERALLLKASELEEATSKAADTAGEEATTTGYTNEVEEKGLEFGLFKTFQNKDLPAAGELLKQYGGAYLITSISFAIVSFAISYTVSTAKASP